MSSKGLSLMSESDELPDVQEDWEHVVEALRFLGPSKSIYAQSFANGMHRTRVQPSKIAQGAMLKLWWKAFHYDEGRPCRQRAERECKPILNITKDPFRGVLGTCHNSRKASGGYQESFQSRILSTYHWESSDTCAATERNLSWSFSRSLTHGLKPVTRSLKHRDKERHSKCTADDYPKRQHSVNRMNITRCVETWPWNLVPSCLLCEKCFKRRLREWKVVPLIRIGLH